MIALSELLLDMKSVYIGLVRSVYITLMDMGEKMESPEESLYPDQPLWKFFEYIWEEYVVKMPYIYFTKWNKVLIKIKKQIMENYATESN
jgi:hypothetical protein